MDLHEHCRLADIVSGSPLPLAEALATDLGNFDAYSYARDEDGAMTLRIYSGNGFREVNQPHEALAAAIDAILRNRDVLTYGHYVVGSEVGIWAQGPLRGATASDGAPIHSFQFRRLSGGDHEIWLAYGSFTIHGGRNLPWELTLQVLQAAHMPQSSTIKVWGGSAGARIATCNASYDLVQ